MMTSSKIILIALQFLTSFQFCLPKGLQLLREDPGPSFFPFVLTSIDGTRNYGAVLTFYEILPDNALTEAWKKLGKGMLLFVVVWRLVGGIASNSRPTLIFRLIFC